jgi:hypothetical protein
MRSLNYACAVILGAILISCAANKSVSTLYSDDYDKTTDQTTVMVFPYGKVKIPGRWTKIGENEVSEQKFFVGQDSVEIAIAIVPWDGYEFSHKNPEVTLENFVRRFYEWEGNYLKDKANGHLAVIKENTDKKYLIWNLKNEGGLDVYFLFGLKGKTAYNLNVETPKWNEESKVSFLEQLFLE